MNICDTLFDEVKIILYNRKEDDRGTMSVIYDDKQLDMAGITFVTKEQRIYSIFLVFIFN